MALFTEENAPSQPTPAPIQAWKPGFKTAVIDTRHTPQSDLIAYIEGSAWIVDYYSKVVDEHDEMTGQDVGLPAPYQQYNRISSMELKVSTDLRSVSQDDTNKELTIVGQANVYPFLTPQTGDMFRAGVADGREALFKVVSTRRMSMFTETVHEIEYKLINENSPEYIFDLEQKVQNTYYFIKDFLLNRQNPLLIEKDYRDGKELEKMWYDLIYTFFHQFFSREHMTLLVPGQNLPTYDHEHAVFTRGLMDSFDDVHIQAIRLMNIGDDMAIQSVGLWQLLYRRDPKLLKYSYSKTGLVSRGSFHTSGLMGGMRFTGINQIVYPVDAKLNVDYGYASARQKTLLPINIISHMEPMAPNVADENGFVPPVLIKPVNMEDGYVLSSAFYQNDKPSMSLLEILLHDFLETRSTNPSDIMKLCDSLYEWGAVEKFYYTPLILLLIKYHLRRL